VACAQHTFATIAVFRSGAHDDIEIDTAALGAAMETVWEAKPCVPALALAGAASREAQTALPNKAMNFFIIPSHLKQHVLEHPPYSPLPPYRSMVSSGHIPGPKRSAAMRLATLILSVSFCTTTS
jgi:hypothetical protein